MTCRFFLYQVATSSFSNIIGTVIGHPLDTVRVSSVYCHLLRSSLAVRHGLVQFGDFVLVQSGLVCRESTLVDFFNSLFHKNRRKMSSASMLTIALQKIPDRQYLRRPPFISLSFITSKVPHILCFGYLQVRMQIEQGQTSFLRTCSETLQGEGVSALLPFLTNIFYHHLVVFILDFV